MTQPLRLSGRTFLEEGFSPNPSPRTFTKRGNIKVHSATTAAFGLCAHACGLLSKSLSFDGKQNAFLNSKFFNFTH